MSEAPEPTVLASVGPLGPLNAGEDTPAPGGPSEHQKHPSDAALCAPKRVLPPDHPLRLLAQEIQGALGPDEFAQMVRAVNNATKAHNRKLARYHELTLLALKSLEPVVVTLSQKGQELYRNAVSFHNKSAKPKPTKVKLEKAAQDGPTKREGSRGAGDEITKVLMGLTLDEVYAYAQDVLGTPQTTLRSRYGHLNPGMQRMNLGNRIRAKAQKESQ